MRKQKPLGWRAALQMAKTGHKRPVGDNSVHLFELRPAGGPKKASGRGAVWQKGWLLKLSPAGGRKKKHAGDGGAKKNWFKITRCPFPQKTWGKAGPGKETTTAGREKNGGWLRLWGNGALFANYFKSPRGRAGVGDGTGPNGKAGGIDGIGLLPYFVTWPGSKKNGGNTVGPSQQAPIQAGRWHPT